MRLDARQAPHAHAETTVRRASTFPMTWSEHVQRDGASDIRGVARTTSSGSYCERTVTGVRGSASELGVNLGTEGKDEGEGEGESEGEGSASLASEGGGDKVEPEPADTQTSRGLPRREASRFSILQREVFISVMVVVAGGGALVAMSSVAEPANMATGFDPTSISASPPSTTIIMEMKTSRCKMLKREASRRGRPCDVCVSAGSGSTLSPPPSLANDVLPSPSLSPSPSSFPSVPKLTPSSLALPRTPVTVRSQ